MSCNDAISIHKGMGTTQGGRFSAALQPDFFLLDERTCEDFLVFVQQLSAHVKFFNELDAEDGDWAVFFASESTAILVLIGNWNISLLHDGYDMARNEIFTNADPIQQKQILTTYFGHIERQFGHMKRKASHLDSNIPEKESLLSSAHAVKAQIDAIQDQILPSDNIKALVQGYVFERNVRQLFGLLTSWKDFSQRAIAYQLENNPGHKPHYALFLTFLKLLDVARKDANGFSKKHLDFYYKDVLRVTNRSANPDYVHLIAEPLGTKPFILPKGTVFPAGKGTDNQKKYYASTSATTVNALVLDSFLSVHRSAGIHYRSDLLPLNAKGKSFDAFLEGRTDYREGIMLASPLLWLQSGERIIDLRFNDEDSSASHFDFFITGREKVIAIKSPLDIPAAGQDPRVIRLTIPASEKPIVPFDKKLHSEFLVDTPYPVLKIIPRAGVMTTVSKIRLNIKVNNFKSFVLESDFGAIDPEKPFFPFGEFPRNGNGITISSNEFFMKRNAVAHFDIDFSGTTGQNINQTKAKIASLKPGPKGFLSRRMDKGDFEMLTDAVNTVQFKMQDGHWQATSENYYSLSNSAPIEANAFDKIAEKLADGRFRIELADDDFNGDAFMQSYFAATQNKIVSLPEKPQITEFTFNYSVTENIQFNVAPGHNEILLYHALPYGFSQLENYPLQFYYENPADAEAHGSIYLGFKSAQPHDGLNFLIQLEEGTANPQLLPAEILWKYLDGNTWRDFEPGAIGDETLSLTQSGLVSITLPDFDANHTRLQAGMFWLRISVSDIAAVSHIVGIHLQAFKAVLTDYEHSGLTYLDITPKETITKSYQPVIGLKKIIQPYSSFGGRAAEKDELVYRRISERLRHKNRAITAWDYERIVLEEFPEVFRVKTLNHFRYDSEISNVAAGYVTLIPVARASASSHVSWKPLLSLNKMTQIKGHLGKIASPHARICVKPPKAERVQLQFKVRFRAVTGVDSRLFVPMLTETINKYLSPWAYDSEVDFAGDIEFSALIRLIDNQEYVDFITDFRVFQFLLDANDNPVGSAIMNLTKVTPQTDYSLFIPHESHTIQEL